MRKTMRTPLSLVLALVLTLGLVLPPGTASAAEEALEGSGTADNPYLIADAADLAAFRDLVNGGDREACAQLTTDIALNEEWKPFYPDSGYITDAYAGTFNGGGHTISGLSIYADSTNQGLFGAINGAMIKNLNVKGSVYSSKAYVGGIVGKIQQGTVENCSFSGSVETGATGSTGYVGGIAGYAGNTATQTAVISGCVNTGSVQGSVAGGITGYAKYTEIADCYNTGNISGSSRSGGIAGQLQNNCTVSNCYHIGEASGSTTSGSICDFLYSSSKLQNCYSRNEPIFGTGTGTVETCETVSIPDGLTAKLGSAFQEDVNNINGGWPILAWQAGGSVTPKEPQISIGGSSALYMTNSGPQPTGTLTVQFKDMDPAPVQWSITNGLDVIALAEPENPDGNGTTRTVEILGPGKASVTASAGGCSAEKEITVYPCVTTVEIEGIVAAGETVRAKVNVLGGELDYVLFPELKFQWRYLSASDYAAGNTGNYQNISNAAGRAFTIPENLAGDYLSFALSWNGESKTPNRTYRVASAAEGILSADSAALKIPEEIREAITLDLSTTGERGSSITWTSSREDIISSAGAVTLPESGSVTVTLTATLQYEGASQRRDFTVEVFAGEPESPAEYLKKAVDALGDFYKLNPTFGTNQNVIDTLKASLDEKGFSGIDVGIQNVQAVYGGGGIAENGDLTYFYADPNSTPVIRFGSYQVNFTLSKDGTSLELPGISVIIPWDAERVKETMRQEILSQVTLESITGSPDGSVDGNLTLPKTVDSKRWTLISWQSSDPDAVSISAQNQTTADTLFEPYVGVIKRGETARPVTLTAAFTFQLTSDVTGQELPIVLYQTFTLTVPPLDPAGAESIRAELLEKLDQGFAAKGLTDAVTGERLAPDESAVYTVCNDIQLPTTRDFGVDGKYDSVVITVEGSGLTAPDVNNAARVEVLRPAPGEPDSEGSITVTLSDRDTSVTASKTFDLRISALTREEIEAELALMERVKAAYFDGLKGSNTARDDIRTDLNPFQEVYEQDGELVWVRSLEDRVYHGIVPTPIEGWEALELWRCFKSSNPNVISHENLLVTRQTEAKAVTVTSFLSSETLGRYGALYQEAPETYGQYAALSGLYYQEVTTDAAVLPAIRSRTVSGQTAAMVVRGTRDPSSSVPVVETLNVSISITGLDGQTWTSASYTGLDEASTVYDVFVKALGGDYTATRQKGTYIVSISGPQGSLAEKQYGENSGWMYRVNGEIPDVYMGACPLRDGDSIQVFYTRDAKQDDPNWDWPVQGGNSGSEETNPGISGSVSNSSSGNAGNSSGSTSGNGSNGKTEPASFAVWNAEKECYEVTLPENRPQVVTLPEGETGQIVVRVSSEGVETVIRKSLVESGKAKFWLDGNASVRLKNYANHFSDVAENAWYASAVDFASGRGLLAGVSTSSFAPDRPLSRGMLAVVLFRLEEPEFSAVPEAGRFTDVAADAWYAREISWASNAGIVNGYADSSFCPDAPVTRAQLAAMLYRYAQMLGLPIGGRDTLDAFSDSGTVSGWARDALAWAVDAGILQGRTDGTLDPNGMATRAEAAVMLQRFVAVMLK